MDVLTSVLFYALAALALIGALGVALLPTGSPRAAAFLLVAVGAAGMYAVLAAGFAAAVALLVLVACGLLLAPLPRSSAAAEPPGGVWHQAGALACAALFAVLAYAAYRGGFFKGTYGSADFGFFNAAAMGRLLLGRDALATEAAGALLLLALVTGGARWTGWALSARRRR